MLETSLQVNKVFLIGWYIILLIKFIYCQSNEK